LQIDVLDGDCDPFPEVYNSELETHGTNTAGVISMQKGNKICGVGVAYNAFITG